MGNDGGSIPKRRELVKNAARAPTVSELKATALESLAHTWNHCALSGLPLDLTSVVSDWRGQLYSYEAILRGLSETESDVAPTTTGIRSLRDVAKLKVHHSGDKAVCPISMKELGPATRAVYIVPCGHVFAEVALAEIQEVACPECAEEFDRENIIPIIPTATDLGRLEKRMEGLKARGLTHTLKKDKAEKKKKRKAEVAEVEKPAKKVDARIGGINNPLAASLTARVLAEQDERNKRRKMAAATKV